MKIRFDYGATNSVDPEVVCATLSKIFKSLENNGVIGEDVNIGRVMIYPVFTDNDGTEVDIDDSYYIVRNKKYAQNARRRKLISRFFTTDQDTGEATTVAYLYKLTNE